MILKISLLGLTAAHLPVATQTVSLWNRSGIGVQEAKIKSTQKLGFIWVKSQGVDPENLID